MKIIVTEEQLDKFTNKLRKAISDYGFEKTSEMTGVGKLKLAKMTGLPIIGGIRDSRFHDDSDILVSDLLEDLIKIDETYKDCEISYLFHTENVEWNCSIEDGYGFYDLVVTSTPYYDISYNEDIETTAVTIIEVTVHDENGTTINELRENELVDEFECPKRFENVDELINWFNNEYKPQTYKIILKLFKEFKKKYL